MQEYERPLRGSFFKRSDLEPRKNYHKDGIFLRVRKSGSRYFEQRLTINGKRRNLGFPRPPAIYRAGALRELRRHREGTPGRYRRLPLSSRRFWSGSPSPSLPVPKMES